jgi:S1-C subfamily serine protease
MPMRRAFVGAIVAGALVILHGRAAGQGGTREVTPTGGIFHSNAKSTTGLHYRPGVLQLRPDGKWASADYPVVAEVDSGSAAERAGFRSGDVILTVNDRDARLGQASIGLRPNEPRRVFRVRRGSEEMEIVLAAPVEHSQ